MTKRTLFERLYYSVRKDSPTPPFDFSHVTEISYSNWTGDFFLNHDGVQGHWHVTDDQEELYAAVQALVKTWVCVEDSENSSVYYTRPQ